MKRTAVMFYLNPEIVKKAREVASETDIVRSLEAALAACVDYHLWVREVARGEGQ